MKIRNMIAAVVSAVLVGGGLAAVGALPANATDCVPSDAVAAYTETIPATYKDVVVTEAYDEEVSPAGWQRYSWTGGPLEDGVVPEFPSDSWQANTASDPHGVGVEGAYEVSHGQSGKADWFYLEAVAAVVVHHDAVTESVVDVPEQIIEHEAIPAVVCGEETTPQIALYCYEKLDADSPASWENSGTQTLAATRDGATDWTDAEKRELCDAPPTDCEPTALASQTDWVNAPEGFTWPATITAPADNIGWPPIYRAHHADLAQTLSEDCGSEEPPVETEFDQPILEVVYVCETEAYLAYPTGFGTDDVDLIFGLDANGDGTIDVNSEILLESLFPTTQGYDLDATLASFGLPAAAEGEYEFQIGVLNESFQIDWLEGRSFTIVIPAVDDSECATEEPPVVVPPVIVPPAVIPPTGDPAPTPTLSAVATPSAAASGELAHTGFDGIWFLVAALAALVLGGGALAVPAIRGHRK